MTTYSRYWRIASGDWTVDAALAGSPGPCATRGAAGPERTAAKEAEIEFRDLVDAGWSPDPILVGPYGGEPLVVADDAAVTNLYAWREPADGDEYTRAVIHNAMYGGAHIVTEIESDDIADDATPGAKESGSVLIRTGRMVSMTVSPWLAAQASALTSRYGVPVAVEAGDMHAAVGPSVVSAPPIVVSEFMGESRVRELVDLFEARRDGASARADSISEYGITRVTLGAHYPGMQQIGRSVAAEFGLHADEVNMKLMAYPAGVGGPEHTDAVDDDPWSRHLTGSFSILLNRPGIDFEGGEFWTPYGEVEIGLGDLVGFTARTLHAVRPVKSGERLVLVGHASTRR